MSLSNFESNLEIARISIYDQPGRIVFGAGGVEKVGLEAKRLGTQKILIVTDKGISKTGLVDNLRKPLEKEGLNTTVFDELYAEPTVESIEAAVKFARQGEYELVVGFGGGSSLDTAKMCAALLTNPGGPLIYLNPSEDKFEKKTAPKILIPTTSGTGSEVSNMSVVIEKETTYKIWAASSAILAEVAIVDPMMVLTCPSKQTAASALDALSHNIEALMCRLANPISDSLAIEAVKLISRSARIAYNDGDNLQARADMALASMFGGIVIAYPWIAGPAILGHCISEALGPRYNIPHGTVCGIALPYVMEFNLPGCMDKLALIASSMGEDTHGLSIREAARKAVDTIYELMQDIELPTCLKELNVPKTDLADFAKYIVDNRQHLYGLPKYNPRKITYENTFKLLEKMWEGR